METKSQSGRCFLGGFVVNGFGCVALFSFFLFSCTSEQLQVEDFLQALQRDDCPTNFVPVPARVGYSRSFCLMKYEAKKDGSGRVLSQARGLPWVGVDRDEARRACQAMGEDNKFDLIGNDEWQTVARNIESVATNWGEFTVGSLQGLNRGHSDNSPSRALEAYPSDERACFGTGETCNAQTWHLQKRIHTLSNGERVWDLSGNVGEWVRDEAPSGFGTNSPISLITNQTHTARHSLTGGGTSKARNAKGQFGPRGDYSSDLSSRFMGMGYGYLSTTQGGILRGGYWVDGVEAGVFATYLARPTSYKSDLFGFRCVYYP